MSKSIIIAAAVSAIFIAAPAFAQDCPTTATAGHVKVFDGNNGGALRAAPTRQTTRRGNGFDGPHGSATNLRDTPSSDPTAGRGHGFDGPNGSASNLRDAPRPARHIPDAKVSCRKTGGDGAAATTGLRKVGTGTLAVQSSTAREPAPARMRSSNNLKQIGLANTED